MPAPRLTGAALATAAALARTPAVALLKRQGMRDYGVERLRSLGAADRRPLDVAPRPIQGRAHRVFGEGGASTPTSRRTTSAALRDAFARGTATPRSVLDALITRIEAGSWGRATHSPFCDLDFARAREAADAATARWQAGRPLGPLDGIPVSIKDQQDVAGLPTRAGTAYLTTPARQDCFTVARLREAGAVLFAKTSMTEWGMSPVGYNPHQPMPRNVYSSAHAAGGSSTGAGVAVALGYGPVAVGADGGGSIRIPSAMSGIYGLKPTYGRVSHVGDACGDATIYHMGPLAASVGDLADWMATVGWQRDDADATSLWAPDRATAAEAFRAAPARGVRGARIGVLRGELADADPGIARACEEGLRALERAGAVLVDVSLAGAEHAAAIGMLVIGPEAMANLVDHLDGEPREKLGSDMLLVLRLLRAMTAEEVLVAARHRAALRVNAAAALAGVDVLALPTTACLARPYAVAETGVHIADPDGVRLLTRFAFLGNLTGLPAGSAPVGMADGLPVGLQIVGDAWDEASVLAVLAELERSGLGALDAPDGWAAML